MSTPGRKRVQPIFPNDDDDDDDAHGAELTKSTIFSAVSSFSSSTNLQISTTSCPPEAISDDLLISTAGMKQLATKKDLYVPLNFDELSHIRNIQTNREFAVLLYDFKLYTAVVNGHICFSCRKVQFSLFKRSTRCAICLQYVCAHCSNKIKYPRDGICFISLNLLRRLSVTNTASFQCEVPSSKQENAESALSVPFLKSKSKPLDQTRTSNKTVSCCIDCYILFDSTTIV